MIAGSLGFVRVLSTSIGLALGTARADAGAEAVPAAPPATVRIEVALDDGRRLPVQLWYPARESARAEAEAGHPLAVLEPEGPRRAQLRALLARAHEPGTTRQFHAAIAAPPRAAAAVAGFPLIVYSHGLDGVRFASLSAAEQLARAGFVVAAPDHEGGTLYELLAGRSQGITDAFLERRVADLRGVVDALASADTTLLPDGLRGRLDAARIGVLGHSYGAPTVGRFAQDDRRVRAGATLAAPAAGGDPLFGLLLSRMATLAVLDRPWLYMLASEDLGFYNDAIAGNFAGHPVEAVQVSLRDASHWSFTDICGIVPDGSLGCGQGTRTALPSPPHAHLDVAVARSLAAAHVTAFFRAALLGQGDGPAGLAPHPAVTVTRRVAPFPR